MKLGVAIGVLAVIANGIAVLAVLFLPETKNTKLVPADMEVTAVAEVRR
jgi:hypothetical protein